MVFFFSKNKTPTQKIEIYGFAYAYWRMIRMIVRVL